MFRIIRKNTITTSNKIVKSIESNKPVQTFKLTGNIKNLVEQKKTRWLKSNTQCVGDRGIWISTLGEPCIRIWVKKIYTEFPDMYCSKKGYTSSNSPETLEKDEKNKKVVKSKQSEKPCDGKVL